jgi:hypothetical protein
MPVAEGWKAKYGGLEASEAKTVAGTAGGAGTVRAAPFLQDVVALCNQTHILSLKE